MKTKFKISILVIVALLLSISTSWSAKRTPEKPSATPKVVVTNPSATVPSHVIGVIVSTKNPKANQRIKVTVTGNPNYGDCLINISKGDGTPIYFYGNSKSFPFTASNKNLWPKYDKPGTYTLNIMGNSSSSCKCSGNASVTIIVKGVAKDIKTTNSLPNPGPILLNLISPMNGAKWKLGHEHKIKWTSTNLTGKVRLELVRDKGPMLGIIAEYLPASGSYQWTKAGEYIGHTAQQGKYRIRVRSMTKFQFFDEGDPFSLIRLIKPIKLVAPPVIEGVLPVPPGALTPGTRLFIKGKNFDYQPVEILMSGNFQGLYNYTYNPIPLIKVKFESSTQVNGFVPIFSKKGQLDQTVEIRVKNGKGSLSNPWKVKFVGRKEQKVVLRNDVVVPHCGADGNSNVCNNVVHKDPDLTWTMHSNLISISGYHFNKWGAVGYDKGYDKYKINLKNGWKFKSLQKVKWVKSSGNEKLNGPSPPFPEGESNWTPKIHWEVSPNDHVTYHFKIIAEGPLGTHYK